MKYLRMDKKQFNKIIANVFKQANKLKDMTLDTLPEQITIEVKPANKTKLRVYFTAVAAEKIKCLVKHFTTEVAWHGIMRYDRATHIISITDILVYPQIIQGAQVESDDEGYGPWLAKLTDDQFENMRMQGHSHCNFGAVPSGPDHIFYQGFMKTHAPEFYLFMIQNKSGQVWMQFYDTVEGLMYEDKDIVPCVYHPGFNEANWLKENEGMAKKFVSQLNHVAPSQIGMSISGAYNQVKGGTHFSRDEYWDPKTGTWVKEEDYA